MTVAQAAARILTKHYGKSATLFFLLVAVLLGGGWGDASWYFYLMAVVVAATVWELSLRVILRLAYGKNYRFNVLSYTLVDQSDYGNAWRRNFQAKSMDFLLFDKTIFPVGHAPELILEQNKSSRNIFSVNSLGYRSPEFSPDGAKARLRIFCTGGSTTAGYCVNDAESWPAQLETHLKRQGYDVEVINAGVDGWYSYQELLRFEKEIVAYQPDILLIHQGWNEEFEYSSLSLGKKWRPRLIRNVREVNNLYCAPNRLFSSTRFLGLYLAFQAYFKSWVFIPNMRFTNHRRWRTLLSHSYILSWFDNLVSLARLAQGRNVLVYTINYPALPTLGDDIQNRQYYISNSRLSNEYAHYQAISKARIKRTLQTTRTIIPCLDVEEQFGDYKGPNRLALFIDELHMSARGYGLLAQAIGEQLINDRHFNERYRGGRQENNVDVSETKISAVRSELGRDSPYLGRLVKEQITKLEKGSVSAVSVNYDVPTDRYTTY